MACLSSSEGIRPEQDGAEAEQGASRLEEGLELLVARSQDAGAENVFMGHDRSAPFHRYMVERRIRGYCGGFSSGCESQ